MDIDSVNSEQDFSASKNSPLSEHFHFLQKIEYLMIHSSEQWSVPLSLACAAMFIRRTFNIMLQMNNEMNLQSIKFPLTFNMHPLLGSVKPLQYRVKVSIERVKGLRPHNKLSHIFSLSPHKKSTWNPLIPWWKKITGLQLPSHKNQQRKIHL